MRNFSWIRGPAHQHGLVHQCTSPGSKRKVKCCLPEGGMRRFYLKTRNTFLHRFHRYGGVSEVLLEIDPHFLFTQPPQGNRSLIGDTPTWTLFRCFLRMKVQQEPNLWLSAPPKRLLSKRGDSVYESGLIPFDPIGVEILPVRENKAKLATKCSTQTWT